MLRNTFLLVTILLLATACGGNRSALQGQPAPAVEPAAIELPAGAEQPLPVDSLLPWESLDSSGFVDPATARRSTAINGNSEFLRGADAFQTDGDAAPSGQALRLQSGPAGSGSRSSATYRFPLAGENPATLSTDFNLRLRSDGSSGDYFISIANYGSGRWDWFGPFNDGRVRLPLSEAASGDYISPLGNAFVSVVVFNGSSLDIVGVSLNQFDPANASAPPVPAGLSLSPVNGGIELTWNSVIAADLAGYAVYFSKNSFSNPQSVGVQNIGFLEGGTRHLLSGVSGTVFVAVSAVDLSGNESAISAVQNATALSGSVPVLQLQTAATEGIIGTALALSASGADSYDWDLDGDGIYEISGDATGSQLADTGKAGIIRPAVRGSAGGTAVALGAVSLIISQDLPPVAILSADRTGGTIFNGESSPLQVNFLAGQSYDDGPSLLFSWSLLGDGNFTVPDAQPVNSQAYSEKGSYNAMLQAIDSTGQFAQSVLTISVKQVTGFNESFPVPFDSFLNGSLTIVDGHPAVAFRGSGGSTVTNGLFYSRALDSEGRVWGDPVLLEQDSNDMRSISLNVIAGNPAIAYISNGAFEMRYVRAGDSRGQTLGDWPNPVVGLRPATGLDEGFSLIECNGNPAIAFRINGNLAFIRATSGAGTGDTGADWADPALVLTSGVAVDSAPDLALIDGNPAIAFLNGASAQAHYIRASTASGALLADWSMAAVNVSGAHQVFGAPQLAEVQGNPAISYVSNESQGLRYTRSTSSDGALAGDWPVGAIVDGFAFQGLLSHDLAVAGGRPVIAYDDNLFGQHTNLRIATDELGTGWGPEWLVAPQSDRSHVANLNIRLADLGGLPAVYVSHGTYGLAAVYTFNTDL
ncbi:hypothetical protein KDL44_00010 [bacterium]|nr:hypothetical protein [bacterium]